jgi:hypothetical protein
MGSSGLIIQLIKSLYLSFARLMMYLWFAITPGNLENYRIGIPRKVKEILIVMQKIYGGSIRILLNEAIEASPYDGRDYSIELTLAP